MQNQGNFKITRLTTKNFKLLLWQQTHNRKTKPNSLRSNLYLESQNLELFVWVHSFEFLVSVARKKVLDKNSERHKT